MTTATEQRETDAKSTRKRRWVFRIIALLAGLLVAFAIAEIVVRGLGETDADGNFFYDGKPVGAINPPVEWVREKIARYQNSDDTRMIYDPDTGWSPRPNVVTHKGMYRYDSHGIRTAGKEYEREPKPGVLRVAIFGDSFAHADDVPFEHSWGQHLENELPHSEVINFGLSAGGMDQAYLRWKVLGAEYSPKVVLFGFQAENINRNVNLLRGFYVLHTGIPFSKPRFVIDNDGKFKAVNRPTLPLEIIPSVMANMDDWPLAKHEWFYNPHDFRRQWWHRSRFVSLLVDRINDAEPRDISRAASTLDPEGEPVRVTLRLLREFRKDVEATGGRFYVVHLPKRTDLQRLATGRGLTYGPIWERIEEEHRTIDPAKALLAVSEGDDMKSLYAAPKHAHYSDKANRILADVIARSLRKDAATAR